MEGRTVRRCRTVVAVCVHGRRREAVAPRPPAVETVIPIGRDAGGGDRRKQQECTAHEDEESMTHCLNLVTIFLGTSSHRIRGEPSVILPRRCAPFPRQEL